MVKMVKKQLKQILPKGKMGFLTAFVLPPGVTWTNFVLGIAAIGGLIFEFIFFFYLFFYKEAQEKWHKDKETKEKN